MSLIYRGQAAQRSMTAETVETGITGKFMGRSFPFRTAQKPALKPATLRYRGNLY